MIQQNGTGAHSGSGSAAGRRVVVVGGGLAGLAAAVELASHGLRPTIVEANEHLGGKMNVLEEEGFVFDMGPTIITLPQVFRGIVERAGRRPEEYCELVDLDPQWRCFFEDGTVIDLRREVEAFSAALDRQFPEERPGAGYTRFVEWSRRMMRLSGRVFFYNDLGSVADLMRAPPQDPSLLGDVLAMRMHSTVAATISKHIGEPHLRQVCEHFLQYVGSSPFLAPAILGLIAAAQVDNGCWYPLGPKGTPGGTRMIARTLAAVAESQGVEVITGARVRRILERDGAACGVELEDGRQLAAEAVVSNCDVQRTYRDLLGTRRARQELARVSSRYEPACSGLVLYLGLDRQYEHLAHHNFLFSADSHAEFDDIYAKGIPARDPTLYIAAPSRTDPGQAPVGCEALYVLIHTAYRRPEQRWETEGGLLERYRPVVMEKLKRFGMEDIESHIRVERTLTPDGIERLYNAEGGAIYGLASHGKLSGGFKPRNRSRAARRLYLAGGSSNPGPGVPMVLMSGVTAAHCVVEDLGGRPMREGLTAEEPESMPAGSRRLVSELPAVALPRAAAGA